MLTAEELEGVLRAHCAASFFLDLPELGKDVAFIHDARLVDVAQRLRRHGQRLYRTRTEALLALYQTVGANESYCLAPSGWVPGFTTRRVPGGSSPKLRSTEWAIVPDDPMLSAAGFQHSPTNNSLRVVRPEGTVSIRIHAWRQFTERWKGDPAHPIERFPELHARRHALKRLGILLRGASLATRSNAVKQFFKYELNGATYLTNNGWVFPISQDLQMLTAYRKGKISQHGYDVVPESPLLS